MKFPQRSDFTAEVNGKVAATLAIIRQLIIHGSTIEVTLL